MNIRSDILRSLMKLVGHTAFVLLMASTAWAQLSPKPMGEIASATQTTINGFPAISGMTIFSENRIRTGKQGAAIVNLGRLGRIEFGSETDMTLRFSKDSIGGELHSNRVVVSAQAGVAIAISTPKGLVTADGKKPTVLTIYVDKENARIIARLGEASVISNGKNDPVKKCGVMEGEELSQSPRGGWRRASLAAGVVGAAGVAQMAGQHAGSGAATRPTFTGLFNAGINYSIDPNKDAGSTESFDTSITCRDSRKDKDHCEKKSKIRPNRD